MLLVQVFDQALAGGGAKNINFQYACHPFENCIAHASVLHVVTVFETCYTDAFRAKAERM